MLRGDRLRQLRASEQKSAEVASQELKMSRSQLLNYENGKSDATGDVIVRLAQYYGVSTDYLLGLTEAPYPGGLHDMRHTWGFDEMTLLRAWRNGDFLEIIKMVFTRLKKDPLVELPDWFKPQDE